MNFVELAMQRREEKSLEDAVRHCCLQICFCAFSAALLELDATVYRSAIAATVAGVGQVEAWGCLTFSGWQSFIIALINQLAVNLKRIHGLGVQKIAVTGLQPLGCLPARTATSSFLKCNATENSLVSFHNLLLQQAVAKLNNETSTGRSSFVILDLYDSFMSVLENKGSTKFENPLKPCCFGISSEYSCGSVDANGAKKYTVCEDPESAFFWDASHPTQQGWRAVFPALQATLKQLYH